MSRTVFIARTANDLDQVNRIVIPTFALEDFRVAIGSKTSKCYLPKGSPGPKAGTGGADDFHFIPEKETIEIRYQIHDTAGLVTGAKLELFTPFKKDPLWTLDFDKLGADWWAHGKHVIKWDGRIVKPTVEQKGTDKDGGLEHDLTKIDLDKSLKDFPEGYATLEFPPYKFRLTLVSKDHAEHGKPIYGWTYWQILIHGFEFELGPKEAVPDTNDPTALQLNIALRKKIEDEGGIPADGATRKVRLISNIYKTASAEMGTNQGYTEYKTMWGNGPLIPILAKIRLKDSNDAEVKLDESDKGAVALGNTQFLWDFEDPDEKTDTQIGAGQAKTFVDDAIHYKKAKTDEWPKGDNCHMDRGGKRGDSIKTLFPEQDGYAAADTLTEGKFPFEVKKAKKRKWAALAKGWSKGKLKGRTGVAFSPSRMAGDDYQLTVYLANEFTKLDEHRLDVADEQLKAAATIKKKTGKFQVWRQMDIVKYVRKKNSIGNFVSTNIGAIQANYNKCYTHIENGQIVNEQLNAPNYNTLARNRIATVTSSNLAADFAVHPTADHSASASAFKLRTYAQFTAAVRNGFVLSNPTLSATDIDTALNNWLVANNVETDAKYAYAMDMAFVFAALNLADDLRLLNGVPNGITVMHFNCATSARADLAQAVGVAGAAIDVVGATRNKCLFVLLWDAVDTFVHEIGHHVFQAHFGPKPDAFVAGQHDAADLACIMSYNRPRPDFCGFCMLRIRGWDSDALSVTSASNKS
ncbi:hypothetical protein F183_A04370 [Bryobacterales bacterium F-183]|nr:hypothetical protein F183_A04370 [Bryobacterales bacterium F-183]